jgi:serine/threonine-protein kinase
VSISLGPGSEFGNYRIDSLLGRGGMSVVYLAEDRRLGRRVAIKVLSPELAEDENFRTRFNRESQLAAGLEHPNIVPVYEAGELGGHLYIAMRYVRGTDLRTLITREGPFGPDRTLTLIRPIAAALDAAHRRGLVHRDVKPANILVAIDEGEEHPYLSDFGLTKHTSSKSNLTKTGQFMGTVDYVAPEQIRGEEVDGRTDQYSLACVLFQCLTGEVPFEKDSDVATMFGHLQDPPPSVAARRPDLPAEVDQVLARGMAKEREARYPTCVSLLDELARTVGVPSGPRAAPETVVAPAPAVPRPPEVGSVPPAPPVAVPAPAPARAPSPVERRPPWAILAGLAAALVAIVGGVLMLGGGDEGPAPTPSPAATTAPPTGATGGTGGTGATGVTSPTGPTAGQPIFADDFSDPASGWDVFSDRFSYGGYADGAYVLGVVGGFRVAGDFNTSTQELSTLGDVRVEATATLRTATRDALFGLVCRAADTTRYYYFLIGGNGKYFIGENDEEGAHNFDVGVSPAVFRGRFPNRIAIECVDGPEGVTLRMFVNGVAVNTLIDGDAPIRTGAVGVLVESGDLDMEAAFDDLVVLRPAGT